VRVVLQVLGRLHRKEDLSAVMTVFHVQKEKSVMRQVIFSPSHCFKGNFVVFFPCILLAKDFINTLLFVSNFSDHNFLFRFK